ncbi:transglycosylase [Mycobacteroides abscessus subsp. bolletii]|uniref:hypothetical protein n=1 Tax=Mycobacteroides abscessus TaxID=36809 RepID=UPI0009A61456|nr:hypothetical protein [Mycobacteroides abscessus]SKZ06227.1 transglycosylase [Mycobacteroides abscessus subsp. bolletii]
MAVDALLEGFDRLMGSGSRVSGGSAAPLVRELGPPQVPQDWSSPAAQGLAVRHGRLAAAGDVFAAGDEDTKSKVDAAGSAVAQGKTQVGAIKDDYKLNRDRLAPGAGNPEIAQRLAQLDRQRASDGANAVRASMGQMPRMGAGGAMPGFGGGSPMGALGSMMPAAMAPISAIGPMLLQPLQALGGLASPAMSMLSGLNIPQQVTHQGPPPGTATATGSPGSTPEHAYAGGPANIRDIIDKALDIKGITDPQARANWAAGETVAGRRESNFNLNAINNWDSNAQKGIPSGGWLQFIEPTYRAYQEPGTSNVYTDPVGQAAAFINYTMARYGVSADGHDLAAKVQQADPTRPPKGY